MTHVPAGSVLRFFFVFFSGNAEYVHTAYKKKLIQNEHFTIFLFVDLLYCVYLIGCCLFSFRSLYRFFVVRDSSVSIVLTFI